jgi:hypothetical protein
VTDTRDAGFGGKLDPDAPTLGDRFRPLGADGLRIVDQVMIAEGGDESPRQFLVRATDGTFWMLVSRDPILDGVAYVGRVVNPT